MARVNTSQLVAQATDIAHRADFVRRDPAVVKAARDFADDAQRTARSTRQLAREAYAAWNRSATTSTTVSA